MKHSFTPRSVRHAALGASLLLLGASRVAQAQAPATVSPAMDGAVSRARQLVDNGNGAEARTILDSLVTAATASSNDLAEALFWRATLAERVGDAERDWKRLIIEVPLSPRATEALVRLGELEMLRGHPADARTYFARVVREYPAGTATARSQLWIAKSYVAERDMPRACVALAEASATGVPDGELRLQAEEMGRQCATVDRALIAKAGAKPAATATQKTTPSVTPAATPTATPAATPAATNKSDTAPKADAPARDAAPASAKFSVQLAAYDTRDEAERSAKRLESRGIGARVDGEVKPFRVRAGYYATRAQANAALATLKKQGLAGFVAEIAK
jgi:cell division septation protein DedD